MDVIIADDSKAMRMLVFQGPCLSGLSQESSLFSAGSALVQVGILS